MAEEFKIDIEINAHDNTGNAASSAQSKMTAFEKSMEKTNSQLSKLTGKAHNLIINAQDKASKIIDSILSKVKQVGSKAYDVIISAKDKASNILSPITSKIKAFAGKAYNATISLLDRASPILSPIISRVQSFAGKAHNMVISAVDRASSIISGIGSKVQGFASRAWQITLSAVDRASSIITTVANGVRNVAGRMWNFTVSAIDKASSVVSKIGTTVKGIASKAWQITVSVVDHATAPLKGIMNMLKSPIMKAGAALGVGSLGAGSISSAIRYEDNFATVRKTVDGTPEQLANIQQGIIDLTTTGVNGRSPVRATTEELTELASAGGQLGISTDNIIDFTETMAQLGSATNLGGTTGAQALARFMNVAGVSQDKVRNLGSTIVDLGNNFATTEAEIMNMALDMGATGATVGMSAQSILGYSTALSSMGIDAAAGGSSLQRIWMDMQNAVSGGGEELEAFAKVSGKSASEFKQSWGKDADTAFRGFLQGLNKLPGEEQVGLLSKLGFNNVRDQRALLALAGKQGFGILTDAIGRANKAWKENTALQEEANAMTNTTAGQIDIAKQNITEAGRSLGEAFLPMVKKGAQTVSEFAQGFAKISSEKVKPAVEAITELFTNPEGLKDNGGSIWEDYLNAGAPKSIGEKIKFAWDEFIVQPFSEWWNNTGRKKVTSAMQSGGSLLGSGLSGGIKALFGLSEEGVAGEGISLAGAFINGFKEGFDGKGVIDAIGNAFKEHPIASSILSNWLIKSFTGINMAEILLKALGKGGGKIIDLLTGGGNGGAGGAGGAGAYSCQNMYVNANTVYVYGNTVREMSPSPVPSLAPSTASSPVFSGLSALALTAGVVALHGVTSLGLEGVTSADLSGVTSVNLSGVTSVNLSGSTQGASSTETNAVNQGAGSTQVNPSGSTATETPPSVATSKGAKQSTPQPVISEPQPTKVPVAPTPAKASKSETPASSPAPAPQPTEHWGMTDLTPEKVSQMNSEGKLGYNPEGDLYKWSALGIAGSMLGGLGTAGIMVAGPLAAGLGTKFLAGGGVTAATMLAKIFSAGAQDIEPEAEKVGSDTMNAVADGAKKSDITQGKGSKDLGTQVGMSLLNAIGDGIKGMDEKSLKELNIGENIMNAMGSNLAGMDTKSLKDLNIGENLMTAISGSLENMDPKALKDLNIGESLMNAIGTNLTEMDAKSLKDLDIGENLMNTIGNSLAEMDTKSLKDLNIGENLMNTIGSSLAEMDVKDLKDLNIGENLLNTIGSSLSEMDVKDLKDLNIGENLMNTIGESLEEMDVKDLKDLNIGESLMNTIGASLAEMDTDTLKDLEIGTALMDAISGSLSEMDADTLGDLEIGTSLMNAIGSSLSEMDTDALGDLEIGTALMNAISTSLSEMDTDALGDLEIGSTIMNAISSSLSELDTDALSDLNIGETIMSAISSSFENIDIEGIDIGSKIMEMVNSSLESVDFSQIDIGSKISEGISASLEAVDISGTIEPIISQLEELNAVECNPQINITDNASETISMVQGLVDTYGATTATAILNANDNASGTISSVSAALSALDGRSATVTVNIQTNGSMPSGAHFAKGTKDAPGGWSVINDQRGGSNATELVDQGGSLMEFAGRDVMVPLAKHAKVYTAQQRERMLSALNYPHYKEGKDNEESAFIPYTEGADDVQRESGKSGTSATVSGVNISVTMQPSIEIKNEGGDENRIINILRTHFRDIADDVADQIAEDLLKIFPNMPTKGEVY